jgi:hypothetical protein
MPFSFLLEFQSISLLVAFAGRYAYMVFAMTVTALQACFMLIGAEALQWSKLCNIYTCFCEQADTRMLALKHARCRRHGRPLGLLRARSILIPPPACCSSNSAVARHGQCAQRGRAGGEFGEGRPLDIFAEGRDIC